jgi:hypothetical protein
MQDHPAAHELLEQLAAWLAGELRERVPREERFSVLVAANVAAIVARETAPGAPSAQDERRRMAGLLELAGETAPAEADARELQRRAAAAIRAGRLDARADEALALVRESVRTKLAVARPGYDDWSEPPPA